MFYSCVKVAVSYSCLIVVLKIVKVSDSLSPIPLVPGYSLVNHGEPQIQDAIHIPGPWSGRWLPQVDLASAA